MKTVYVNDVPIGEAWTWAEAEKLLATAGISFIGRPGAAEGPTGFFIHGTRAISARERKDGAGENIA
jgi:hypothetical protein